MTTAAAQRARFAGTALATSSPQVLLLRLYDRLALDLRRAVDAQVAGDHQVADRQLQHAQEITSALANALDVDSWDGAKTLKSLYTWLLREMVVANTQRDAAKTRACLSVVEPLRSAWHEAQAMLSGGTSQFVEQELPAPAASDPEPALAPSPALQLRGRAPVPTSAAVALLRERMAAAGRR